MNRRLPLVALAGAQFIMVLDQSVMNVSISQLVEDFDTTVTTIQAVITLYCLVMAMFMLTGAKIGDIIGRRRAFVIGLDHLRLRLGADGGGARRSPSLTLGWSILEGIGAALVLPAMAALIAGNFEGKERKAAYAVIGGVAGAGIAIGPILGGWATTELTLARRVRGRGRHRHRHPRHDPVRRTTPCATGPKPRLDVVGAILSAAGLGASSSARCSRAPGAGSTPKDSPVEPFGLLADALRDRRRRPCCCGRSCGGSGTGRRPATDPLVHLDLVKIPPLRAGPDRAVHPEPDPDGRLLHRPAVPAARARPRRPGDRHQDAADVDRHVPRGRRRLAAVDPVLGPDDRRGRASRPPAVAAFTLLATIEPELDDRGFAVAMGVLGRRHGAHRLPARQRGPVVGRRVGPRRGGRPPVHRAAARLLARRRPDRGARPGRPDRRVRHERPAGPERISDEVVVAGRDVAVGTGIDFVSSTRVEAAAAGRPGSDEADDRRRSSSDYEEAQLRALKAGLLAAALLALASLAFTGDLPRSVPAPEEEAAAEGDAPEPAAA